MTTTPAKVPSKEGSFGLILKSKQNALRNFLGNDENALKFMSSVMNCIQKTPGLLECAQPSLLGAFMEAAALGLMPGGQAGDCYVLPYRTKNGMMAQFQMGYKGFKTLAFRSGIARIGAEVVYENDFYEEERGTAPKIVHRPPLKGERGEAYRVYAWAEIAKGDIVFVSMSKEEVLKIKAMSKAKDSGPWASGDPMLWMWKKTALKQLAKLLPTSDKLERAVYVDNVNERGGYIKSEGELDEVPFEPKSSEEKISEGNAKKEAMRKKPTATAPKEPEQAVDSETGEIQEEAPKAPEAPVRPEDDLPFPADEE